MYLNLLTRISRRIVSYSERWKIYQIPNKTHRSILLHSLKAKRTGFSLKVIALPFAGSLAFLWIKAQCNQNPDEDLHSKLLEAVRNSDLKTIKSLIGRNVDVNERHEFGWTALHVAVINSSFKGVEILLNHEAKLNLEDEYSNQSRLAKEKNWDQVKVHNTRKKAFPCAFEGQKTYQGCTALHYAVMIENEDIVEVLLKAGANPLISNKMGYLPRKYAKNNRIQHILWDEEKKLIDRYKKEEKMYPLEQRLKNKIIGQQGAIEAVAAVIRRKEYKWYDEERPLVLLFLGSSGIGKTELSKQVANYLHEKDTTKAFIRIDMSEYQNKHEVAKLIGSPPGYLGHDEGSELIRKLTEYPNSVVLFDEVDKAHPDVLTILLQLFDEGRLTDGKGKTIECKKAVFIMTANLASEEIHEHAVQLRKEAAETLQKKSQKKQGQIENTEKPEEITISRYFKNQVVTPKLKKHFGRDEFLGRINEIIYFLPFSDDEITQLVNKELSFWKERALKCHKFHLIWDNEVESLIAAGFNSIYGARSIKYEVEQKVVTKLALAHEQGLLPNRCLITVAVSHESNVKAGSSSSWSLFSSRIKLTDKDKLDDSIYLTVSAGTANEDAEKYIIPKFQ